MSDRQGPQATDSYSRNWLILFGILIVLGVTAFLAGLIAGDAVASTITLLAASGVALFAFADGGWRLLGNEGLLGPGWGFDRVLALIQIVLAVGVLFSLFV